MVVGLPAVVGGGGKVAWQSPLPNSTKVGVLCIVWPLFVFLRKKLYGVNPQGTSISLLFAHCFIVGIFDEQYGFVSAMLNQNSFAFVGCFNELFYLLLS